jgi:hypothetical protein
LQASRKENQIRMKLMLIQIISIILLGMILNSCSIKKGVGEFKDNSINILSVDSLKFLNYFTCEFEAKNDKTGFLLIKKSETDLTSNELLMLKKIYFSDLCDVIEFQPNDSEITYRGHATMSGIYENGELLIDLSNDIEKRYYQPCYGIVIERKK